MAEQSESCKPGSKFPINRFNFTFYEFKNFAKEYQFIQLQDHYILQGVLTTREDSTNCQEHTEEKLHLINKKPYLCILTL